MKLNDSVQFCKGVGEQRAQQLHRLGIYTVFELLSHFPTAYEDRSQIRDIRELTDGETACVRAMVVEGPALRRLPGGRTITKLVIADDSGEASVSFFNQTYTAKQLSAGKRYSFYGRFARFGGWLELTNPAVEPCDDGETGAGRIVPIYRLTAGLGRKTLSTAIGNALAQCAAQLPELLPASVRETYGLLGVENAYRQIHAPATLAEAEKARKRLAFEELFLLACALGGLKQRGRAAAGFVIPRLELGRFLAALPFALTGAQERAIREALEDMASGHGMNRLVQGDVGSGKTMVAAACVWAVCKAGYQAAFMAPTELLADQHSATLSRLLEPLGIRTVLLKGSMSLREKRLARERLALGEAQLAIGTHALLSEGVEFRELALAITDEQHRFGVNQRAALAARAVKPHVLVMSATPIPRTLALFLYGDLDVSLIDELPPGRQTVDTFVVGEEMRPRIQRFIARQVDAGRQVYIVCPMIEEDETGASQLQSASQLYEQLQQTVFSQYRLGLLHGKLRPAEKESVMAAFAAGEIQILVSTTVVEVGVDVPNATLMVVENADRFGMSQLHQLRGRVGRGKEKSYCILFQGRGGGDSAQRLRVLTKEHSGFRIAEEDLRLRGPGDFFGQRQHGLPVLHAADLSTSLDVLKEAQAAANRLLEEDPALNAHPALKQRVAQLYQAMQND